MPESSTDLELMRSVQQGDLLPLGNLFERHHARMYSFCLRMTGSAPVAEDLVQEVFVRVMRYRETFRGDRAVTSWLYSIARNVCYDHYRRTKADLELGESAETLVDPACPADQKLEQQEESRLLHEALLELPIERREVLILSRFELRNYAEIADLLGCSVGAVKVRVHRAVKHLRRCYVERLAEANS